MKTEYKQEIAWVKLMVVRDSGRPEFPKRRIMSSQDIYGLYKQMEGYFTALDREEFVIIGLDGKNRTIFFNSVSVGSLSASIVHPREVFKMAILGNAASLILCHNHPSGDPTPSPEDIEITKKLGQAGELLGIKVLDHIIFGDDNYTSFADNVGTTTRLGGHKDKEKQDKGLFIIIIIDVLIGAAIILIFLGLLPVIMRMMF